jgi:hypothetical protein
MQLLIPILEMNEEEKLKSFTESISRKSWARILKIVRDAIGEERTQEDKTQKIIDLLYKKGECINSGLITLPITTKDATFEGAKATIIKCWSKCGESEKRNLTHHFETAKAIYLPKETFCNFQKKL